MRKAQEERESLAKKMADMESKLIVGGVNLVGPAAMVIYQRM